MEIKIFINKDGMANFTCPECQHIKAKDVSEYINLDRALKIKCKCQCGHSYKVILERRRHYRKETNLPGTFTCERIKDGSMTVENISMSGLGIRLLAKKSLEIGEKLMVKFNLDDKPRSLIEREVIVRNVKKNYIGVEFCSMDHYDRLGGYLI